MHNYIWCPYYLPSFMKFCSVVSEELCWQAASVVNFGKFLSSKGHNSHKIQAIKIPGNMHNYIWCPYYLPSFMKFCWVVSEELHWQTVWQTDRWTDGTRTICLPTKVWGGGDIIKVTIEIFTGYVQLPAQLQVEVLLNFFLRISLDNITT
jgi:hypothetical protein